MNTKQDVAVSRTGILCTSLSLKQLAAKNVIELQMILTVFA